MVLRNFVISVILTSSVGIIALIGILALVIPVTDIVQEISSYSLN